MAQIEAKMIIATLFLKAIETAVRKAERSMEKKGIKKAMAEIKEPERKYNREFGPTTYTRGNVTATDTGFKKEKYDPTITAYARMESEIASDKSKLEQPQKSLSERVVLGIRNLPVMAVNAVDNTLGNPISNYQNYKVERRIRKHPNEPVAISNRGLAQTRGAGHRIARSFKRRHINLYHTHTEFSKPLPTQYKNFLKQIKGFHKKAKVYHPEERNDIITGHSSGGNLVLYAAGDPNLHKYGIKHVQAVAPTPYGIRANKLSHKLMGAVVDLSVDDVSKSKFARQNALKMYHRKPIMDPEGKHGLKSIEVIAGKNDGLVPVKDTYYKHATAHHVFDHPKSTHFYTSGTGKEANEFIAEHAAMQIYGSGHKKKEYRRAA